MPLNNRIKFLTPDEVQLCRISWREDARYYTVMCLIINFNLELGSGWGDSISALLPLRLKQNISFHVNVLQLCLDSDE